MGTILEKPIQDTKESQSKNLDRIDTTQGLTDQLKIQNISDLGDPRLTIKQDHQKYIFAIDGEDSFYVHGKKLFERLIGNFYEQQSTEETRIVVETTNLKLKIFAGNDPSIQRLSETQDNAFNKTINIDDFKRRLDTYKEFFEAQIDDVKWQAFWLNPKYSGKEKAAYKITKQAAEQQLETLKKIEDRVNTILKPGRFQHIENFDYESRTTLLQLSEKLDSTVSSIPDFISFRNDIITGNMDTTPPFHMTINSINDAKNFSNTLKKFNTQELILDQYAADAATQQQYAQILQSLEAYFENNLNNPNNFQPYQFNAEQLLAINYFPKLKEAMGKIMPKEEQTQDTNSNKDKEATNIPPASTHEQTTSPEQAPVVYKDAKEAFEKGGLKGISSFFLDKTHMSKEQKDAWGGVGNLALLGGGIFLGWKFLKNTFRLFSSKEREKMKDDGGYAWVFGPIAAVFASNALTGESPLALLNGGKGSEYLANLFGGKKEAGTDQNPALTAATDTYTKGFTGVSAIFANATCGQVAESIEETNGKMKLKPAFVETIVSAAKGEPSNQEKQQAAQAIQLIGEDDPNGLIHTALVAMGLNYTVLKNSENVDKPFKERAANAIVRLSAVISYMEKNNYNRINPDQLPAIQDYIANKDGTETDLDELQKRLGDVFEDTAKAPDETIKNERKAKIKKFDLSEIEQQRFLGNIRNFWMEWPLAKDLKKIDIRENKKFIEIETYGQYTEIDLKNNTIVGLEDINKTPIKFQSTYELLKVANLTNRILDLTKNNQNPLKRDPFNVSWLGGDIEYNNTKFWSNPVDRFNHMDITVASGGTGGALKEISQKLEDGKDGYAAYLNIRYNAMYSLPNT